MSQINSNNFFRWFTDSNVTETSAFPRLGITDAKIYLPQLVSGEVFGFYINADIPFFDADDFTALDLIIQDAYTGAPKFSISNQIKKVSLASGYRLYCSYTLPNLSLGQYQFAIYNSTAGVTKCLSNYFQVISADDANLYTVSVKWQNSRDAYYYDWSKTPSDFFCQLRLNISLNSYQPEETIDQTKAVSTGLRRNNNFNTDLSYKLHTYYFDDGANMACIPLFKADNLIINGKNFIQKTGYIPNARPGSKVSIGEIELYDQYFSTINKYGQLPQFVTSNSQIPNSYTILNNSTDDLTVSIGVSGGGVTDIRTMGPNSIFQVPITMLDGTKYVTLSYADSDPLTTISAILVLANSTTYTRTASTESPATPFGNVSYADLLNANYFMVFGTVNAVRETTWRGLVGSKSCVLDSGIRTGDSVFGTLQEYYTDDNSATGVTKPNIDTDPDYIAPTADPVNCPIYVSVLFTTGSVSTVCGSTSTVNGYVPAGQTQYAPGTQLFTDSSLTTPMPDGYYRDSDSKLHVVSGVVTEVTYCSSGG